MLFFSFLSSLSHLIHSQATPAIMWRKIVLWFSHWDFTIIAKKEAEKNENTREKRRIGSVYLEKIILEVKYFPYTAMIMIMMVTADADYENETKLQSRIQIIINNGKYWNILFE